MKLIIEQAHLLAILTTCKSTVESKAASALLACVRLRAADGHLEAMTTAVDIQSSDQAPAEIDAPGEICVNQSDFHDLVRRLPDGSEVLLEVDGATLTIRAGRVKASMPALDADKFPALAPPEFTHDFMLPAGDLIRLLRETEFAMSTAEDRFTLCSVYLHTLTLDGRDFLAAAAIDGVVLAWSRVERPEGAHGMPDVMLPSKTVNTLLPLLGKRADKSSADPIRLHLCDTKVGIQIGSVRIITKLIEGAFPDYLRIIPADDGVFAKLPRRQLQLASERAVSILEGKSKAIHLEFDGGQEDGLHLTSASGASSIEDRLNVIIEGGPAKVIVNGNFLAKSLASFACDDITIALNDPGVPLRLFDDQDDHHGVVIHPMRG
jgi:DNA polymerase-3 subunit beta